MENIKLKFNKPDLKFSDISTLIIKSSVSFYIGKSKPCLTMGNIIIKTDWAIHDFISAN